MNFNELTEINFVDTDILPIYGAAKKLVEEELGRTLARGDPLNLYLKTLLSVIIQQRELINTLAKENLLAYASGENLEHFGILVGCERLPASKATCTVEVKLSAPRLQVTTIKKGTRINAGNDINFALDDDVIFLVGETTKTAKATCTEFGKLGNDFEVGELNKIVDPQAFLQSIENTTKTEGGADIETDDSYRERIRITPESFSVAGPSAAYEYFAKAVSTLISDVYVESPAPGEVDVYALLEGGQLPDAEMLEKISAYLNDRSRRPLTDKVTVKIPAIVEYDIECRYFISRSNAANVSEILALADKAVAEYVLWQKSKLGRDINPTELIWRLRSAGVKRVEVLSPAFEVTAQNTVAVAGNISAIYFGLEDD